MKEKDCNRKAPSPVNRQCLEYSPPLASAPTALSRYSG